LMADQKRILLLDSSPFCGGAQESFWSLASALREAGFPLLLLSADQSAGGLLERAREQGIPCRSFAARHWPVSLSGVCQYAVDFRHFGQVWQSALAEFQPALIHANCLRSLLLLSKRRAAGIPLLLHDRDLRCPAFLPRLLTGRVQKVAAVSSAVAAKWQGLLAAEQIHVIPNGFVLPPWPPPETGNGINKRPFTVLQVADFVPWKNHHLFLETVCLLSKRLPNLRAVIRGRVRNASEARWRQRVEQQRQRLGLAGVVEIIDSPGSADEAMREADILLSCAEDEPFGRALIEALALGKVVVAVDGGGPAEILCNQSCGSLCPAQPKALAQAVLAWQQGKKYLQAASAARTLAEKYSLPVHLAAVTEVYEQMLSR
jgi:glycosyltransferase involved in cell wall biosynthesis